MKLLQLAVCAAGLLAALPLLTASAAGADAQPGAYEVRENVEFTSSPEPLKLDAHVPPGKGPFPAVILVHGGGWVTGTKTAEFIRPLFPVLDRTGFTWFTIDYRLAPQHKYPAPEQDVESAIRFVKEHAREFKVDPKKIALMGESAGAHLVNVVGARNKKPVDVAAVVSFYGPIDLLKLFGITEADNRPVPHLKGVFGIETLDQKGFELMRAASPEFYLSKKTPPFLFINGTKDAAVPYEQATLAMELFKKHGLSADLITVQDGIHGVSNWESDPKFQGYKTEMIDWLKRHLQ